MNRIIASKFLRDNLDKNGLEHWHIRLITDLTRPYLGLCDYKTKTIILNAHHIDVHPDEEVYDTIYHEIAHALCPQHGHDSVWAEKARELGCTNTLPCSHLNYPPEVIDAIRSGAEVKIEFDEQVIRTPRYKIQRFEELCPTCNKPAKEVARVEKNGIITITLACFHFIQKEAISKSPFETLTFDGDKKCKHVWGTGKERTKCKKCSARKLYDYQVAGARLLETYNGRFGIMDEQGLGKTIQTLAYLYFNKDAWPFLWVTKSGIKYQHAEEIVRVLGEDFVPLVIKSGKDKIYKGFNGYVISYDLFRRFDDLKVFKDAGIKTLVLDECQAIKNPDSSRTRAIREVAREIPHIIPTSGTPWKNRGSEFFVALNMLDPVMFNSYESFVRLHCDWYFEGNKKKVGGIARPNEFKKKVAHILVRRERKEVMPEIPTVNRTLLKTELEGAAAKIYQEEVDKILKIVHNAEIDGIELDSAVVKQAVRAHIMTMKQIVGIAKVPTTLEFVEEFLEETERKIVIFVHHIEVMNMMFNSLTKWCKEHNEPLPLVFRGGSSPEERAKIRQDFNSPAYRVMVASTLSAGEGLNLQTCSDMVMHERQWNAANEEQAESRFARIGQEADSVNATYVLAKDTIDIDLDAIVESKRTWFEDAMNKDGYQNNWNESNLISELLNRLLERSKKK